MTETFSQSFIEYFPDSIIFFTLSYSPTKTKKTKQTNQQKSSSEWLFYVLVAHTPFFPTHKFKESSSSCLQFISSSLSGFSSTILEFKGSHNQQYCSCIFNTLFLHNRSVFMHWIIYMLPSVMKHNNFFRAGTLYLRGIWQMTLSFWIPMLSSKKMNWKEHLRTWGGGRVSWDEVRGWHWHTYTTKCKIAS